MKVGILTYYNAINYGAVLQAYALQNVIERMGHECELINYPCPAVEKQYRKKRLSEHESWKVYIMQLFSAHRLDIKKDAFKKFRKENMKLSEEVSRLTSDFTNKYNVLISGSDQVFNPKNTEGDTAFLLDVRTTAKKISYAASIGNSDFLELWKSQYGFDYIKALKEFNELSFREEQAAEFVSELLGNIYETVLDPVLLVDADFWKQFKKEKKDDYIFVYNLGNLKSLIEIVHKFAKTTGLQVVVANKDVKGDFLLRKYKDASSISPADFVSAIANAKYVITDSFHGTAFSVLLHKDFYSVVDVRKGNTSSRLYSLLKKVGLESRIISEQRDVELTPILNYQNVDKTLSAIRTHSIEWLKAALDEIE